MTVKLKTWGKMRRLRSKSQLLHNPLKHGKGRWHSRSTLWRAKRHARRLRIISAASRRANCG